MATMRRVDLNAITFLFVGTLCGALLMFGVGSLRHSNRHTAPSIVVEFSSSEMAPPVGGRLGGINSSDTANDFAIRQSLKADAGTVVGGRLGGIASSDTATDWFTRQALSANDATVKTPVSRITGPGEGLNQFVDPSSYGVGSDRITGPGEGLNQYRDTTNFDTNSQRIVGPGEGMNQVP